MERDEANFNAIQKKYVGQTVELPVIRVNPNPSPKMGLYSTVLGSPRIEKTGTYGKSIAIVSAFIGISLTEKQPEFTPGQMVKVEIVGVDWTPAGQNDNNGNPRPQIPALKCLLL